MTVTTSGAFRVPPRRREGGDSYNRRCIRTKGLFIELPFNTLSDYVIFDLVQNGQEYFNYNDLFTRTSVWLTATSNPKCSLKVV